jgi:hypothetical protein
MWCIVKGRVDPAVQQCVRSMHVVCESGVQICFGCSMQQGANCITVQLLHAAGSSAAPGVRGRKQEAEEADLLARHELQRAMRAEVQHRVRLQRQKHPTVIDPHLLDVPWHSRLKRDQCQTHEQAHRCLLVPRLL